MIFINKSADYSDIKIGTVELPFTPSAETADILSHYTKVLSSGQTILFDDFVNTLKQEGLLSLINHLYLPMLAGTPSEALYDYAAETAHDVGEGNEYYEIGNKGLRTNKNASTKELVNIGTETAKKVCRFFSFFINDTDSVVNTAMFSDSNIYIGGNGFTFLWSGTNYIAPIPRSSFQSGLNNFLYSTDPSANKFYAADIDLYFNGVKQTVGTEIDGETYGASHVNYLGSFGGTTSSNINDILIYFDLRPVSAEEAGIINTAVNTLLSNFWD